MNRFDVFFDMLVKNEGWYSNDKNDSGKETILGVSSKSFPTQFKTIKGFYDLGDMVNAKDAAKKFYYDEFYNPLYDNILDERVAFRLFDFGVNAGVHTAVKYLQQTLGIVADGIFGLETLKQTNSAGDALYENYNNNLKRFYQSLAENNPKDKKFLTGWLARLDRTV